MLKNTVPLPLDFYEAATLKESIVNAVENPDIHLKDDVTIYITHCLLIELHTRVSKRVDMLGELKSAKKKIKITTAQALAFIDAYQQGWIGGFKDDDTGEKIFEKHDYTQFTLMMIYNHLHQKTA